MSKISQDLLDKARFALSAIRNLQNADDDTEIKFTVPGETIYITIGYQWKDSLAVMWTDHATHKINPLRHVLRELLLEDLADEEERDNDNTNTTTT